MWWILIAIVINWLGCYVLCNAYCLWLRFISKDINFEGWIWWRGVFPIVRYRLVPSNSWFAKAWTNWYGHGLLGCIIHKDQEGEFDDSVVEKTIVHEIRHTVQQLVLGLLFYVVYGINFLFVGYEDVWFEKDARQATANWVAKGKPHIFDFGKRY